MTRVASGSARTPLDSEQTRRVLRAVDTLSPEQLQWVSGYVAGLAVGRVAPPPANDGADETPTLTVLYGSQTGNGRAIAERVAAEATQRGFAARALSLADYKPASLKRESVIALVVSTHGEGEPPDDAELIHEFLLSERAPKLPGLSFSVLALGDSSYVNFCQTGRELDARLADLGAERSQALVECDLDYAAPAAKWSSALLEKLAERLPAAAAVPKLRAVPAAAAWGKDCPFPAEVLVQQKITGAGSTRDVYHLELSLEGAGLTYEPGDALAVICDNPPQLVAEILDLLGAEAADEVRVGEDRMPVADALRQHVEITSPSLGFLQAWARHCDSRLSNLLEPANRPQLAEFLASHQIVDILRRFPADVGVQAFVASLRPLSPRSYSIASGPTANPDEVHLTVAAVRYEAFGHEHWGAASTHLADRVAIGDTVRVFVESNPRFRLPADDMPVIMIGPGTGVAPFRAFVEERAERAATGANWLFFGDRNFRSDFLYQLEWLRHLKNDRLQRLDVAFSRDQDRKVYVQQRIVEHGADVYRWLQDGAAIFVCGNARQMAGDVHAALVSVLAEHGGLSSAAADAELKALRRSGRYQRDVY